MYGLPIFLKQSLSSDLILFYSIWHRKNCILQNEFEINGIFFTPYIQSRGTSPKLREGVVLVFEFFLKRPLSPKNMHCRDFSACRRNSILISDKRFPLIINIESQEMSKNWLSIYKFYLDIHQKWLQNWLCGWLVFILIILEWRLFIRYFDLRNDLWYPGSRSGWTASNYGKGFTHWHYLLCLF